MVKGHQSVVVQIGVYSLVFKKSIKCQSNKAAFFFWREGGGGVFYFFNIGKF